jgi:replication-associated recombination protein RarA
MRKRNSKQVSQKLKRLIKESMDLAAVVNKTWYEVASAFYKSRTSKGE